MTNSLLIKAGRYLSVSPEALRASELNIDLHDYINASQARTTDPEAAQLFIDIRRDLAYQVSSLNAANIWNIMLNQATLGLNELDVEKIISAPVSRFMVDSFVELVKTRLTRLSWTVKCK